MMVLTKKVFGKRVETPRKDGAAGQPPYGPTGMATGHVPAGRHGLSPDDTDSPQG